MTAATMSRDAAAYYAGGRRVMIDGAPCRVAALPPGHAATLARIKALAGAADAAPGTIPGAPGLRLVAPDPAERARLIAEAADARKGKPGALEWRPEFYEGAKRMVIGGVPCRVAKHCHGLKHKPGAGWASMAGLNNYAIEMAGESGAMRRARKKASEGDFAPLEALLRAEADQRRREAAGDATATPEAAPGTLADKLTRKGCKKGPQAAPEAATAPQGPETAPEAADALQRDPRPSRAPVALAPRLPRSIASLARARR